MSRLSMRKISEVLRQRYELKNNHRDIGRSLNISAGTVSNYLARAKAAGITWPLPESMTEQELYAKLFLPAETDSHTRTIPDWSHIHRELRRKAAVLNLPG